MRFCSTWVRAFCGLVVLAGCAQHAGAREAIRGLSWSPDGTKIVFARGPFPKTDIYVMDAADGSEVQLTTDAASMLGPSSWSPDGSSLLFTRGQWPDVDLYVMDADGANPVRLTKTPGIDYLGSWAPDGRRLVFASNRDVNMQLYTSSVNGSDQARLTKKAKKATESSAPHWSPNGDRIAFHSKRDGNYEIYVVGTEGKKPKRLTNNPSEDIQPQWSPNGDFILFVSGRQPHYTVQVMEANGKNQRRLTRRGAEAPAPRWAPDGSHVLCHRSGDIFVVTADDAEERQITDDPAIEDSGAWSPDGSRIAFVSYADGTPRVVIIDSGITSPASTGVVATAPAPEPRRIDLPIQLEEPAKPAPPPVETPVEKPVEKTKDKSGEPVKKDTKVAAKPIPTGEKPTSTPVKQSVAKPATPPVERPIKEPVLAPEPTLIPMPKTDATDAAPKRDAPPEPTGTVPVSGPGYVKRAVVTRDVVNREPVDTIETLVADSTQVAFFTELVDMTGTRITHRWSYRGEVRAQVTFDVGGPRWRVYSKKRLYPGWSGVWEVSVIGPNGKELHKQSFVYQPISSQ